jgi:glycosyltransferase involved in cell wall biosynthesis
MSNDLVSVIIPAFNGERFLAEAIGSVFAQRYEPLEVIVVNDGSTDGTGVVAACFGGRVRYFLQPNRGPAAARNRGLREARGEVIAFNDADDVWATDKLRLQLDRLRRRPQVEVVLGRKCYTRPEKTSDGRTVFVPFFEQETALNLNAGLFRRSAFERVGHFDEGLRYAEDWDWFMRARELGAPLLFHDEVVLYYRRHENNLTNQLEADKADKLKMLKRSLDRRRARHGVATSLPKLADSAEEAAASAAGREERLS